MTNELWDIVKTGLLYFSGISAVILGVFGVMTITFWLGENTHPLVAILFMVFVASMISAAVFR